jgi:hypothetical protein
MTRSSGRRVESDEDFVEQRGGALVFRAASGGGVWETAIELPWWEHWLDIPMNGAAKIIGWPLY